MAFNIICSLIFDVLLIIHFATSMHYLSCVYFVNQTQHVSGMFVAHHQEVYYIEPTGYRSSRSPLPCKPSRTFYGRRKYLSPHFLIWSLLWRLVRLYLWRSREGEETDRSFLLGRLVWSMDSDWGFVRGRISVRWLASRNKDVAALNSGGAWTVWYVDGKKVCLVGAF